MTVNFECDKCGAVFDCEVGRVGIDEATLRPTFERPIECPSCGVLTLNDARLTERGQGQMTDATWEQ